MGRRARIVAGTPSAHGNRGMALRAYVNGTGMGRARGIPRVVGGKGEEERKGKDFSLRSK